MLGRVETAATACGRELAELQQLDLGCCRATRPGLVHVPWTTSRHVEPGAQTADLLEATRLVTMGEADAATWKRGEARERLGSLLGDDVVLMLPPTSGTALLVDASEAEFQA